MAVGGIQQLTNKGGRSEKNVPVGSNAYLRICIFSKEITALCNDSFLVFLDFFLILLSPRYADTQIRR